MAATINSVLPVLASQAAGQVAPELTLQQGSVVNAQVLKVLSADLVRIAIANLSIDVQTEVPLQAGQDLQLAVSQGNDGGVRLRLVGPDDAGTQSPSVQSSSADTVTLSPGIATRLGATPPAAATGQDAVLTPVERIAVAATVQTAAAIQGSQAPLFANLAAIVSAQLPPKLQAAA